MEITKKQPLPERLYLIIPVFNRKETLLQCLNLLEKQTYRNFSVIVVDDGSSDGTAEAVSRLFPDVRLVFGNGNWWWSRSINEGVKVALCEKADAIVTMNDDADFKPDYLEKLLSASVGMPGAIIGSLGLTQDNPPMVFYSGIYKINWLTAKSYKYRRIFSNSEGMTGLHPAILLNGTGVFIPAAVFEKIGFFDEENFPQNLGDFDFMLRAHKARIPVYISWDACMYAHIEKTGAGASFVKQNFVTYLRSFVKPKSRTNLLISWKYFSRHCPWYYLPISYPMDKLRMIVAYFKNQKQITAKAS